LSGASLPTAAAGAVDVILRDGGTLRLRPPTEDDSAALLAFFAGLSEESRYKRFHGVRKVDEEFARPWVDPDWEERGVLAGFLEDRVVALADYNRVDGEDVAEVAFLVADAEQRRGIGTRLLEQLAARAREHGITEFVAEVMAANAAAVRVFADTGFELSRELEGGEIELRFPIAPTGELLLRVESRDHVGVVASLRPFFEPATVAVIGASRRRGSIGGELFRNMLEADFAGAVYPVNREGNSVAGVRGYRAIDEIPDAIDLGVLCIPADAVLGAAAAALKRGVRALCVVSAGFAETGAEGRERQDRLLALVRAYGARLIGPNCLGVAVPARGLNATFAAQSLPAGRIGFSSQSGALGLALLEKAAGRALGFSAFVSIGNKADVSSNDLLEWWEGDDGTDLVLLYLESFGNPRKFAHVARRVARAKPVLALKAGATSAGSRAAGSHTAALAGSDAAVEALFHQAGVLRAHTLEELLDATALLAGQPAPQGPRVGVLTNAGGLGILCADACEAAGLELPTLAEETRAALRAALPSEASLANPVDLLGSATAETYEAAIGPLLSDPNVDALVVLFVPPVVATADDVAAAIVRALAPARTAKPVVAVVVSAAGAPAVLLGADAPVASLPYPESAARALALAWRRTQWLRQEQGEVREPAGIDVERARRALAAGRAGSWLGAAETQELLEAYGIPLVPERFADDAAAAVAAARELGFPVVVKSAAAGAHKTETGGVALDLGDAEAVREAAARIGGPVLVQPFLEGGVELLAGALQDPVFGPLVAFGPGGVYAELIGGASFRLAPLTDLDALELVRDGKAGRLVAGFRGSPPADASALADLLERLGRLADDLLEVAELDLNPVLALPDRCVVLDARVRVGGPPRERALKSW